MTFHCRTNEEGAGGIGQVRLAFRVSKPPVVTDKVAVPCSVCKEQPGLPPPPPLKTDLGKRNSSDDRSLGRGNAEFAGTSEGHRFQPTSGGVVLMKSGMRPLLPPAREGGSIRSWWRQ